MDDDRFIEILTAPPSNGGPIAAGNRSIEHLSHREPLLQTWHAAAQRDPARAIRVLDRLREEGHFDAPIWSHGLAALVELPGDPGLRDEALGLLERLPHCLLREQDVVRSLAMVFHALCQGASEANHSRVLAVWDWAFAASTKVPVKDREVPIVDRVPKNIYEVIDWSKARERASAEGSNEPLVGDHPTADEAINHPSGLLTEGVLIALRSREPERNGGLEGDVRTRLERVIATSGDAARLGRILVARGLPLLYDTDRAWARQWVVPLLRWKHREEEAGAAWRGFLRSVHVWPSLWEDIKGSFFETFDHLAALGEAQATLAAVLAEVCMEWPNAMTASEAARCLRKLDDAERGFVALRIREMLKGAEARAPNLWRKRAQPWLESSWPTEPACRGPAATTSLVWAATWAGDAFPEAVACVARFVARIDGGDQLLDFALERGLVEAEPAACLELADALAPEQPRGWLGQRLRGFLNRVREAAPQLAEDPRFQRLDEIALRKGA